MRPKIILFIIILFGTALLSPIQAQDSTKTKTQQTKQNQVFVDEDGDGYNDNAPDHDGDGIPNSLDADWIKLQKEAKKKEARRFVDLDGDGIDDNLQMGKKGKQHLMGEQKKSGGSLENKSGEQKRKGTKNRHGKD